MTNKAEEQVYDATSVQVLEGLEPVRVRPGMYIGGTGSDGYHHLLWEIVDNSVDEAMNGHADLIEVVLHANGTTATVSDNGRGIPVANHPKHNKPAVELLLTVLHSGSKFDGKSYKNSGGLHGVGSSVVNALSSSMTAKIKRDGGEFEIGFSRGKVTKPLTRLRDHSRTGTRITFSPDPEIFGQDLQFDVEKIRERLEVNSYVHRGLKIKLKDEGAGTEQVFYHPNGIQEYIVDYAKRLGRNFIQPEAFYLDKTVDSVRVELVANYTDANKELYVSFANGIPTHDGGTHEQGVNAALIKALRTYVDTHELCPKGLVLTPDDLREGAFVIVSVFLPEPQFQGQTKDRLNNPEIRGLVEGALRAAMEQYLNGHRSIADLIVARVIQAARARIARSNAEDTVRRKSPTNSRLTLPGKLADCSSTDPSKCELFVCEGDSAGGCFAGGTLVRLVDGRALSFEQLWQEEQAGLQNYCYSKQNGLLFVKPILNVRKTKTAATIQLQLNTGDLIKCTSDHLFMLSGGTYKAAELLTPNDQLAGIQLTYGGYRCVNITPAEEMDVWDLEVPDTHNFALASGVFVHNSAKMGRQREYQAILPLRGKVLNTESVGLKKIMENEELTNIVSALGCGIGKDFDIGKLRYHKIILMADADFDGSHITTLLLTFFFRHLPGIIKGGHLYLAQPPLFRIDVGQKTYWAADEAEKTRILKKIKTGKPEITRFKGLGEMPPKTLYETTLDPAKRRLLRVVIPEGEQVATDRVVSDLMGKDPAARLASIMSAAVTMLDH